MNDTNKQTMRATYDSTWVATIDVYDATFNTTWRETFNTTWRETFNMTWNVTWNVMMWGVAWEAGAGATYNATRDSTVEFTQSL